MFEFLNRAARKTAFCTSCNNKFSYTDEDIKSYVKAGEKLDWVNQYVSCPKCNGRIVVSLVSRNHAS